MLVGAGASTAAVESHIRSWVASVGSGIVPEVPVLLDYSSPDGYAGMYERNQALFLSPSADRSTQRRPALEQ